MALDHQLITKLQSLLPEAAQVVTGHELQPYARDFWGKHTTPGMAVQVKNTEQVATTLRFASEHRIPVTPRAAGTNNSRSSLPQPDGILLDLRMLNRIHPINVEQRTVVVEAGVINGHLQDALKPTGLFFPPDPASSQLSTIGGNIAENAGGTRTLKLGVTVHHVKNATCVLTDGSILQLDATKTQPDLLGLLVGSEGTLAVITQATVALLPIPSVTRTLLAIFDHIEDTTDAILEINAQGILPSALEFFDQGSAIEFEKAISSGYPTDAEALLLIDVAGDPDSVSYDIAAIERILKTKARELRIADNDQQRDILWQGRVYGTRILSRSPRNFHIAGTTVPLQHIPTLYHTVKEIIRQHQLNCILIGHIGDGNIHPIFLYDAHDPRQVVALHRAEEEMILAAIALGGSITGEHGIGSEKRHFMTSMFSPDEIAAQRAVKEAFDPQGILNPGILLPDRSPNEPLLPMFAQRLKTMITRHTSGQRYLNHTQHATNYKQDGTDGTTIHIDTQNLTVTAKAHTPLSILHTELAAHGFQCALPTVQNPTMTLGQCVHGNIARLAVQNSLLSVQAHLIDGNKVRFGSLTMKDVAGYDMKRLFIGSGTKFGSIDEITLKAVPLRSSKE
jgi:glycolate oxidase